MRVSMKFIIPSTKFIVLGYFGLNLVFSLKILYL